MVFASQAFFLRIEIREHLTWSFTWNESYQACENNQPFHGHSASRGTEERISELSQGRSYCGGRLCNSCVFREVANVWGKLLHLDNW